MNKYVLKPSEFYKKNISIVADDVESGIDILSDLLYKISLIKDVYDIYDDTIHIVSTNENKKLYKKMLLENPYLYFTNFDVKNVLLNKNVSSLDNLTKKTIYIFDNKMAMMFNDLIKQLVTKNVHVFILCNQDDVNGYSSYNLLTKNRLLIYKPNKLKMIHKKFYKYYVKYLDIFNSFETYFDCINDVNLDIKYVIFKDNELRYN